MADCLVLKEEPPKLGYGAAALKMAATMRLAPKDKDGNPVEGKWLIQPISWRMVR